ncbi:putative dash complex subunit [Botrytis fragariae]|uniref:DASH complex subunit DAD1 n=1 Tax=Botrytis fragariae TaxID=1964551 RepID=A0A8H6EEE6_9HELO|nr:putative dash complex subunit [Botrytis fragariae]KAF5869073.1 putative dash complex subunit [Botrytis fragariae]
MSSSTSRFPRSSTPPEKSYFEQQREILLGEIAISFEHVLSSINKLNRSLEGVIAVGNEFSSVEALWSQFENVMAKDPSSDSPPEEDSQQAQQQQQHSSSKREEHKAEETLMEDDTRV